MDRIRVTLEPVTAAFVHIEPEGEACWRAAPFRGLIRWWFRAVVGAATSKEELRQREARIFGTAESASSVAIRIRQRGMHSGSFAINPSNATDPRYTATRKALVPRNAKVELEIAPTDLRGSFEAVREAYAALWVASHFGGIGQRSRRGAGSLRLVAVTGIDQLGPITATDHQEYAKALSAGLRVARRLANASNLRSGGPESGFPVLHPDCAAVWVVRGPGHGDETEVRRYLMDIRRGLPTHRSRPVEPEFGLAGRRRLASPVWVRVADFNRQRTLFVVTLFRHRPREVPAPDWRNVEEFVTRLGDRVEVDLR
jgi:CRISPR type III-B/RAMP module RAMP protein Cmr1